VQDLGCGRTRKSVAGCADGSWDSLVGASGGNIGERRVDEVGQLSGLSDHLVVTTLLLGSEGKLVPDVHPVTVLAIDALSTNLNLNHGDKLLTGVV
jgi:hypothetical protein